jgi:hypothetical protein
MLALSSVVAAIAHAIAAIDHARAVTELTPDGERRERAARLIATAEELVEQARSKAPTEPTVARELAQRARSVAWAGRAVAVGLDG